MVLKSPCNMGRLYHRFLQYLCVALNKHSIVHINICHCFCCYGLKITNSLQYHSLASRETCDTNYGMFIAVLTENPAYKYLSLLTYIYDKNIGHCWGTRHVSYCSTPG